MQKRIGKAHAVSMQWLDVGGVTWSHFASRG